MYAYIYIYIYMYIYIYIRIMIDIQQYNSNVSAKLNNMGLRTTDVTGDGNCFYRAAAVSIMGYDDNKLHNKLRHDVADYVKDSGYILDGIIDASPDEDLSFVGYVNSLATAGTYVGEDVAPILANITGRQVIIHIAYADARIYMPPTASSLQSTLSPIELVFFKPGHYMAVLPDIATNIGAPRRFVNHMDTLDDFDAVLSNTALHQHSGNLFRPFHAID